MAEFVYTGNRRNATLAPGSAYELHEIQVWTRTGRRNATLTPGSASAFDHAYAGSLEKIMVPDYSDLTLGFVYEGNIPLNLVPGAKSLLAQDHEYAGDIGIDLAPSCDKSVHAVYAGALAIDLAFAATCAPDYIYAGDVPIRFLMGALTEGPDIREYLYTGNIPLALTVGPAITLNDAAYLGNIPIAFALSSDTVGPSMFAYAGNLPLTLTPTAFHIRVGPIGPKPRYAIPKPRKRMVDIYRGGN